LDFGRWAGLGFGLGFGCGLGFDSGFAAPCPAASFGAGFAASVVPSRASLRASSCAGPWAFFDSLCEPDVGLGRSAEQPLDTSNTRHARATSAFMPVVEPPNHAPMRPISYLPDPRNQALQALCRYRTHATGYSHPCNATSNSLERFLDLPTPPHIHPAPQDAGPRQPLAGHRDESASRSGPYAREVGTGRRDIRVRCTKDWRGR
jgi:hypothetical protein